MAPAPERPKLAFWIHQVVEYLLGVLVITQALQSEQPIVPVLVGLGLVLLAATADGPLAAFHVVPRRLHRVLDVVAVVLLGVVAYLARDQLGTTGVVFTVVAAVALLALLLRTSYAPRRSAKAQGAATTSRPAAGGSAGGSADGTSSGATPSKTERYGRAAGRAMGKGIRSYKDRPGGAS